MDTTQDVWWNLAENSWKRLRGYDPLRGIPFGRFLWVVCSYLTSTCARKHHLHLSRRVETFDFDMLPWHEVSELLILKDLVERMQAMVEERLGPAYLHLFIGYYRKGMRIKEIGAKQGWKEGASLQRKHRLDRKLREFAKELLAESFANDPESNIMGPRLVTVLTVLSILALETAR